MTTILEIRSTSDLYIEMEEAQEAKRLGDSSRWDAVLDYLSDSPEMLEEAHRFEIEGMEQDWKADTRLAVPATYSVAEGDSSLTVIYQPMDYKDEHGQVLAHLIIIDGDEIDTSKFYSRAWAYWNFIDYSSADFYWANLMMKQEGDFIDKTINWSSEALQTLRLDKIPHGNAYWQGLVVRLAYNAITNADEFANMVRSGKFTTEEVQRMLDLAAGAVLSGNQFRLQGLETIAA
jgi:hypothetical protein